MNFIGIVWLMTLLLPQQGGDVLDVIPTRSYWEARNVVVNPTVLQGMARGTGAGADISAQIKMLSSEAPAEREAAIRAIAAAGNSALPQLQELAKSPDPRLSKLANNLIQVANRRGGNEGRLNRLMAIRTLGEMKHTESLPLLKELEGSKEPFVADYARAAEAAIAGKPLAATRSPATREERDKDLWLLPANCGVVAQLDLSGVARVPAGAAAATASTQPADARAARMLSRGLTALDQIGNLRVDRVTVGVASTIGPREGFFILIARGRYDHATLTDLLRRQGAVATTADGVPVFSFGREAALILPDENTLVFTAGEGEKRPSPSDLAAVLRSGQGSLKGNAAMVAALDATDRSAMLCAAAVNSDSYRALPLPFPLPFDMLRLTVRNQQGKMKFNLDGDGNDAAAVAEAVAAYRRLLETGIAELERPAQQIQVARMVQNFLKSVQIKNEEMAASATAELDAASLDANALLQLH